MASIPDGITLEHNRDLRGPRRSPIYRRLLMLCVAALPILALANVFGQHPSTTAVETPAVRLSVNAPTRLRSGLIFQVRTEIVAHRNIKELEIVFDHGWWESMSTNAIVPEPSEATSENGRVVLTYGKVETGEKFVCWIYFQVNPTNVGNRREDIEVRDNKTPLAHMHRSLTIFP